MSRVITGLALGRSGSKGMHVLFEDREEAGRRVAKGLARFRQTEAVILGIPRGGVPVAAAVAHRLQLPWNVIVTRKLPIPTNPEAGFGAVAADGSIVLNTAILTGLHLGKKNIEEIAEEVKAEVVRRTQIYTLARPPINVAGKSVIVLDDGVASGYTMLSAIKSVRNMNPAKIIAAAPIASRAAAAMIEEVADECIFEIVSPAVPFAVANFYVVWHDLTDEEILPLLRADERLGIRD